MAKKGTPSRRKRGARRGAQADRPLPGSMPPARQELRRSRWQKLLDRRNRSRLYLVGLLLAIVVIVVIVAIVVATRGDEDTGPRFITAQELNTRMDAGEPLAVIDNRTDSEWIAATTKVPTAVHVKVDDVEAFELAADQAVVLYCT